MENYNQSFSGQCPVGASAYTINAGDTFYNLAQRYGLTTQDIRAANPGVDPNNLQIGQTICLPSIAPVLCPEGYESYIVKSGDTFYNLAQRYGLTTQDIRAANPGVDPNNLQIGQTICLPPKSKNLDLEKNLSQQSETTKNQNNFIKKNQQEETRNIVPTIPRKKEEYIKEDYESQKIKIDNEYFKIEEKYQPPIIKEKNDVCTPKQNISNGCSYIIILIAIFILFSDCPKHSHFDNSKKGNKGNMPRF